MGWSAYTVKRNITQTGEYIGEQVVYIPRMSEYITISSPYIESIADLLAFPDFPVESTVFAPREEDAEKLRAFGFGNALSAIEFNGESWFFENGNHIDFLNSTGAGIDIQYVLSSGIVNTISGTGLNNQRTWFTVTFPLVQFRENKQTLMSTNMVYTLPGGGKIDTIYVSPTTLPSISELKDDVFYAGLKPVVTGDPYDDAGNTESGGGEGDFDNTGDLISAPELPPISTSTGFVSIFNPTLEQLKNLSEYMWSDLFDVSTLKKLFANPMDAIIGLSILPVKIPTATLTTDVKVGNISTGIQMWPVTSQYVTLDCGTLNVNEYWGAYLDYSPYTKAEIYLPYIGTHALDVDNIMGKAVHLIYHIDILSGACCAYILCNDTVIYSFLGQCSTAVPVTGNDWTNVINGALTIATSIGSMVATGGATAPMGISQIASTAVNSLKPTVEKSGSMSGSGGLLAVQTPYLILTRPRQAVPRDQNSFTGYPSFITENLADLSGYTEIENIHLENIPATENELNEIETLLKSGVIF